MKNQHGYIAIASVLVISAVVLIIGSSVALLSVNDIQSALATNKSEKSLGLTEGCVEEALLYLNETGSIPVSITLPEGSCSVTINSSVANVTTFTVEGSFSGYQKVIQVSATRGSNVSVNSWLQL